MKKLLFAFFITVIASAVHVTSSFAYTHTEAEVPSAIAVGPGMVVEISFPTMVNPEGCGYAGAYQISTSIDAATRKSMLAVLISAKSTNTPVYVRLEGCSDRPLITYIFTDGYPR